jgi:hypothetical protein
MTLRVAEQVKLDFDRSALGRVITPTGAKDGGS